MAQRSSAAFTALFSLLVLAAGCSSRTEVSLTGNTPPQFSHVWLTVKEVRFHTSSTAAVTDSGWSTFTLKTPVTLDLAANTGGTLGALATSLKLLPGTYAQLRLLPLDPSAPLASSAQSAGALYNAEADYVDTAGSTHQLPLELLNPDQGIGVHASLRVPVGKLGSTLAGGVPGAAAPGTSSATSSATSSIGTTGANNGTTTTTGTTTAATTTASTTTTTTFAVDLDATRDLVPFSTAAGVTAVLLSAHPSAYRSDGVGSIQGTLTLTNLTGISASSGVVDLQVSAETLNADGTRHVVVATAPVQSNGQFTVYPLPASSSSATSYDLVIHGAGIATIIVRAVQLTLPSTSAATTQTGTTTTTTATVETPGGSTPATVSVGTLTPRAAAPYTADIRPAGALPADTAVSFYQTPAGGTDAPFVIETSPIDPFNQNLYRAQPLAPGTIDVGTYVSNGSNITLVSSAPAEGAGTYRVAALAPNYVLAATTPTVSAPASGTQPVIVPLPPPVLEGGALAGTVLASLTVTTAAKYTHGEILISHDGALVATAPLDAALAAGGNVSVVVPANIPAALYFATVRVWGPSVAAGAPHRQWFATPADLRSGLNASLALTLD